MEAMNVVDEDLTELTDSELVAVVARYLLLQEGDRRAHARARRRSTIPVWSELAASPAGELYDLRVVHRRSQRRSSAIARSVVDPGGDRAARLRRYCRLRGIELPYRRTPEAGRRARGLGAALEHAAARRAAASASSCSRICRASRAISAPVARAVRLVRKPRPSLDLRAAGGARRRRDAPAPERARRRRDLRLARAPPRARRTTVHARALGVRVVAVSAENAALAARPHHRDAARQRGIACGPMSVIVAPFEPFGGRRGTAPATPRACSPAKQLARQAGRDRRAAGRLRRDARRRRRLFARDPELVRPGRRDRPKRARCSSSGSPSTSRTRASATTPAPRPIDDELVARRRRRAPRDVRPAHGRQRRHRRRLPVRRLLARRHVLLQRRALPRARAAPRRAASPPRVAFVHVPSRFPWARDAAPPAASTPSPRTSSRLYLDVNPAPIL